MEEEAKKFNYTVLYYNPEEGLMTCAGSNRYYPKIQIEDGVLTIETYAFDLDEDSFYDYMEAAADALEFVGYLRSEILPNL